MDKIQLIAGLGNPGVRYQNTRHNIGFETVDFLSESLEIPLLKKKFKGILGEGVWGGWRIILLKPQTFMNLSGESIVEVARWYKLQPSQVLMLYDDVDVHFGQIRIRSKGSAGTHNGMKSVVYHLQTNTFPRIRIGVGRPSNSMNLADFVLSKFTKEEQIIVKEAIVKSCNSVKEILINGIDQAMNLYNA